MPRRGYTYASVLEEVLSFCIATQRHLDDEIQTYTYSIVRRYRV